MSDTTDMDMDPDPEKQLNIRLILSTQDIPMKTMQLISYLKLNTHRSALLDQLHDMLIMITPHQHFAQLP